MPANMRISLMFAAYPTITAAILFAVRRLQYQYPFIDRIITNQATAIRLFHQASSSSSSTSTSTSTSTVPRQAGPNGSVASSSPSTGLSAGFRFQIGSAFRAKDRDDPSSRRAASATTATQFSHSKIKNKQRPASGEDAFFVSKIADSHSVALGVIDGVGGWNQIGVDACDFSHSLAESMAEITSKLQIDPSQQPQVESRILSKFSFPPLILLDAAYNAIKQEGNVLAGGSTACLGVAHENGTLQAANLGDSGFMIFRDGKVHFVSDPQTHFFNAPYQLAIIPPQILERNARYGGKNFDDKPSDANLSTHKLRHGDVVLFVTDGVLDNLSPADCLRIVNEEMITRGNWFLDKRTGLIKARESSFVGVDALSSHIVNAAYKASLDVKNDGPFAREAQRQLHAMYKGGKPDDITALVMFVQNKASGGKTQEKL
ncbi:phosphatase 2C-like domain-containing protein [Lipomyces japonicus]|uniref:phosphatase 2C-like domain-containing protein n=1 Tax=Lipomyces japonicus TaxID=56871 RepID=UPI0034CE8AEC